MAKIQFTELGNPATNEQIQTAEVQYNVKLPEDYKRFLLLYNGGEPLNNVVRWQADGSHEETLERFLSVDTAVPGNLNVYMERYLGRVPLELIPIAHDPGGNLFCMAVDGPAVGSIYFWNHDYEAEIGEAPTYKNLTLICNSFDNLCSLLCEQ